MIKNKVYIIVIYLSIFSCKPTHHITSDMMCLYKNNNIVTTSIETIESIYWYKEHGNIDSIVVTDPLVIRSFSELLNSANRRKIRKYKPFRHPEYAVIMDYEHKRDTLYLDDRLRLGYLKEHPLKFKDKKDRIYTFFKERNFLTEGTIYDRNRRDQ